MLLQSGGVGQGPRSRERRRVARADAGGDLHRGVRRAGRRGAALGERERHRALPGAAAPRGRRRGVHAAGPRAERREQRRLPRRARGEPGAVRAHGGQRARPRELHPGRRPRGDPGHVAGGGAQGAGAGRADVRARDAQARHRLRPVRGHPLAGLPGDVGGEADVRRRRRRHDGRGRHLRGQPGRHVLLLDVRRADRERGELLHRLARPAVAAQRRRSLRRRVPAAPLGAVPVVGRPP